MTLNNTLKLIRKLKQKKYRKDTKLFVAEGRKIIKELLNSDFRIHTILTTEQEAQNINVKTNTKLIISDYQIITKVSHLQTPQPILAIVEQKQWNLSIANPQKELILTLDNIQDPGNFGTIVRLANWFGIKLIVASPDCVDIYNSKTVQATMGALFHTPVVYYPLNEYLHKANTLIYGTFLNGEKLSNAQLTKYGIILMGNEANGIRQELKDMVNIKLYIPYFGTSKHVESLNVAMATAIVLWEFKQQSI